MSDIFLSAFKRACLSLSIPVTFKHPKLFAAIMPLSPHHTPYSYLSLSDKVSHIPTFLHHSTNDKTSKFSVAEDMFEELKQTNKNIVFDIGNSGHSGWNKIYNNPKNIEWLLSWKK